jgi:hypothetical protein
VSHLPIAINEPDDIKRIIKRPRRWGKEAMLRMLKDARQKVLVFRQAGKLTPDEFRILSHEITVARQETISGQYQN